jgi:hypothetical protein
VSKGEDGATSKTLQADGLDAASNDTSGSTEPQGRYAPKGRWEKGNRYLKTETTDVAPPAPPVIPSAPAPEPSGSNSDPSVYYLYNVGSQAAETDGIYTNVYIAKPKLDTSDYHSLGELAVQSADGKQIVEVGWNVDRLVNGDSDPHLFVYHWINNEGTCYNGCGFVQYSKTIKPGDTLAQDASKKFGIQYANGAWWIAFDTEWVGYFPEQQWNDAGVKFNKTGLIQIFGEVAATSPTPCGRTDMGNGVAAVAPDSPSAYMASISYLNGPVVSMYMRTTTPVYPVTILSTRTFRYGGPGTCTSASPSP